MNDDLIKSCLSKPDVPLDADGDYTVCYQQGRVDAHYLYVSIAGKDANYGEDTINLNPEQTLNLLDILTEWRPDLSVLLATYYEEETQRARAHADRINELKAKHSDAVTAWLASGCVGGCPTFEEIAVKSQLVEVSLFMPTVDPLAFNKSTPCLDLLRREQESDR